jgi:hypothetical protein
VSSLLSAALAYQAAGVSIIPCAADATKRPLVPEWKDFQVTPASRQQVESWFSRNDRTIGAISGAVSGSREGIDIDNHPAPGYPDANDLINQMANMVDAEDPALWDRLAIEGTPSGGAHLLYRCPGGIQGNQKLALRPPSDEERAEGKLRLTMIETRGEGGYFISAPSPGYHVLQGDPTNPPVISTTERDVLLRAARACNLLYEEPTVMPAAPGIQGGGDGKRPGDLYNEAMSADDVVGMLEHAGWHRVTTRRDGVALLRRPGKKHGWSATVGYGGTNLLMVFSSNAPPFEPEKAYPPFVVRTLLDFGGDFTQAAQALAAEGYSELQAYAGTSGPLILDEAAARAHDEQRAARRVEMPALPDEATAIYADLAPCGAWLDDYVSYASTVAPTMVPEFHQLAGLFAVGTATARRLCLRYRAGMLFPNLYALFVAPSGYGKTTAFGALKAAVHAAGMDHLFLTDQMTPENLLSQMSTKLPASLPQWEPAAQQIWLRERAFAAQRGWMLDESAFLFDSLTREYMTGLLGLLLKFYDCPPVASRETQGGGRVLVQNVSLSFFGASTTSNMRPHFQNEKWWSDGLWGRFALVVPGRNAVWVDDDEALSIPVPVSVVRGLRHVFTMFGQPEARLVEEDKRQSVEIIGQREPVDVMLAPGVYSAWQVYRKAMAFDIGTSPLLDEPLRGSYSRFATHAMKVAMILAVMDATTPDVLVSLAHYARGQQIAETWRSCMHQVWNHEMRIDERQLADRALVKVRATPAGLTARQLQQQLNRTSKEINDVLLLLQADGLVVAGKTGRKVVWMTV